jgi:hypothetical protein
VLETSVPVIRSAAFSRCGTYRYALWRQWDASRPDVLFVALNPSTADHRQDDPTIRRCMGFARDWGYGGLVVANLFAFRTPLPAVLRQARAPIGPRNDRWLARLAREAGLVVAAWGAHGTLADRAAEVARKLGDCHCLGLTAAGAPRHPLYVRKDAPLRPYSSVASPPLHQPGP